MYGFVMSDCPRPGRPINKGDLGAQIREDTLPRRPPPDETSLCTKTATWSQLVGNGPVPAARWLLLKDRQHRIAANQWCSRLSLIQAFSFFDKMYTLYN